jgi:hypothetical protein
MAVEERGSGYADSDTMVLEAIQKSIHEGFGLDDSSPHRSPIATVASNDVLEAIDQGRPHFH